MTEDEFADWWEERGQQREGGSWFFDVLRRDVAARLHTNFRRLAFAQGESMLQPDSDWIRSELVVVLRPYLTAKGAYLIYSELRHAAGNGDAAKVARLLDLPLDPNAVNSSGKAALHRAAELGKVEVVRCLLEAGAEHDKADKNLSC